MTVLLGAAAVVIDFGRGRVLKQQLRNASEAAAHAGAAQLDGTTEGLDAARTMAVSVAASNLVGTDPVVLDPNTTNDPAGDIVLGYWEDEVFYPSTDPSITTTVQVVSQKPDVATYFAGVALEEPTMDIGDFAIAQGGGPGASDCPFPLAIPDCELTALPDICDGELLLTSARVDNGAWARPGSTQANANFIRDSLDPSVCAAASGLSDILTLNNGQVNSAFPEMGDAVNDYGVAWDTSLYGTLPPQSTGSVVSPYGKALIGQIMVFDDPDDCVDTTFTGVHEVVGFATLIIYDVINQGSNKQIKAKTYCTMNPGGVGGGGFFGTLVPPNIVR